MRESKIRPIIILLVLTGLAVSCGGSSMPVKEKPTPSPEQWEHARDYAEGVLREKLLSLSEGLQEELELGGFKDRSELERAVLGEPVLGCLVPEKKARAYSPEGKLSPLLQCGPHWFFPVLVNGRGGDVHLGRHG